MGNPLHYAVVVGIDQYPGGLPPLKGPVNDARAFADWLVSGSGGGLPVDNVAVVVSPDEATTLEHATPTKERIDAALWRAIKAARAAVRSLPEEERTQAQATTRLYFFVAGHGILPQGGQAALLDATAEPDRPLNLELSGYVGYFTRDGTFAQVCTFADCCRTLDRLANPGPHTFGEPFETGEHTDTLTAWAATAGNRAFEETTDSPDGYRGYFSRALVEGLAGEAVDPATGFVTGLELTAYTRRVVRARTADRPRHQRQRVVPMGDLTGSMVFGPRRAQSARTPRKVRIAFPSGFGERVELVGPDGSVQTWDAADGPWLVWLHDALWWVRRVGSGWDTAGFARDGVVQVNGDDVDVQL